MPEEKPDIDTAIENLEQNQSRIDSEVTQMKLKCHSGISSLASLKHTKKASFDLSKLVP